MNYAVDYTEEKATFTQWKEGEEPIDGKFTPSFVEKPPAKVMTEKDFIDCLKSSDKVYLLGTTVTETLAFISAKAGAEVFRIFAPDLKAVKEEIGLAKNKPINSALYFAAIHKPELFRLYHPMTAEEYLLRRWVRIHYRFQKRFRTGVQVTLGLLEKEVEKLLSFGHLTESKAAAKVGDRIALVLKYAETLENELLSAVSDSLRTRPLWKEVLEKYKGIGPKIGSKIIASGPRKKYNNRDHFVASTGMYPKNGKAVRRVAGEMLQRDSLLFDAFNQYLRGLHFHDCPERELYLKKKREYLAKEFPPWRADRAARRWVGTHVARQIWKKWCELEK